MQRKFKFLIIDIRNINYIDMIFLYIEMISCYIIFSYHYYFRSKSLLYSKISFQFIISKIVNKYFLYLFIIKIM